jgi:hypothetical protein
MHCHYFAAIHRDFKLYYIKRAEWCIMAMPPSSR